MCDFQRQEKIDALKKAAVNHVNRNKEIMLGGGIDRHLFVLYVMSKGMGVSSPFLGNLLNSN